MTIHLAFPTIAEQNCSEFYRSIRTFMVLAGQSVKTSPTGMKKEERLLRARLILEEALETVHALGFHAKVHVSEPSPKDGMPITIKNVEFIDDHSIGGYEDTLDGIADLCYVALGTLVSMGMPDLPVLHAVAENNLEKFGEGGYRDEKTGKWIKPPDFKPVDWGDVIHDAFNEPVSLPGKDS